MRAALSLGLNPMVVLEEHDRLKFWLYFEAAKIADVVRAEQIKAMLPK